MMLKKALLGVGSCVLGLCAAASHAADMNDFLEYYDTDDYGNVVYFGLGSQPRKSYDFIFVDGSKTVGTFSSASIASIYNTKQAGYAVTPANSFEEMSQKAQFATVYLVDCEQNKVEDEDGTLMRLENMSAFHRTSAAMACSVLEMR